MLKINQKICYCITIVMLLISFLIGYYAEKGYISLELHMACLYLIPFLTYIMYIFSPGKLFFSHIKAFISSIIITVASMWNFWIWYEFIQIKSHEITPDDAIDVHLFMIVFPIILNQIIFAIVYLILNYIKNLKKEGQAVN